MINEIILTASFSPDKTKEPSVSYFFFSGLRLRLSLLTASPLACTVWAMHGVTLGRKIGDCSQSSLFIVIITVAGYHHCASYLISKLYNYHILYTCRNKQPPASGLGTASPAYVEARMYAPANAPRRQVFVC